MGKKQDKGYLTPSASYFTLWRVEEPWTDRKIDVAGQVATKTGWKTAVDRLRSMAKGWRPVTEKYQDFERKATILGGIQALQAAGIAPWTTVDLSQVPPIQAVGDETERPILDAVRKVSNAGTLAKASELVRSEVIKHRLEDAAWPARAAHLSLTAYIAQEKRAKVENGVASGLGIAATTATATVVGAPVGAILGALAAVPATQGAKTKIEATRSKADYERFNNEFIRAIDTYTLQQEERKLALTRQKQKRLVEQLELQAAYDAETTAKNFVNLLNGTTWGLFVGGTGLVVYTVYRRLR